MYSQSVAPAKDELSLLCTTLIQNHSQEIANQSETQLQFIQEIHRLHRLQMAAISMLSNPFTWARTIRRYTRQLIEVTADNKSATNLMRDRHEQAISKVEKLIVRQKQFLLDAQRTDALFMDRFKKLFDWSFSQGQRQSY